MLLEDRKPEDGPGQDTPRGWSRRIASHRHTPRALNVATVVVTLVFAYIAFQGIDLKEAWRGLRSSDYWWLLPALAAFGLSNIARALRWRSLFIPGRRPPRSTTLNAMMIGYLYNNILPARAGEAARVLVLTRRSDSPPVEITGTVVLERIYDVVVILALFLIAEPWLPHVSWFGAAAVVAAALVIVIALAAAILAIFGDRPLRLLLHPLRRFSMFSGDRLERTVDELSHGLSGLRDWRVAVEALFWSASAWLLLMLCAYLVSNAFHLGLPFAAGVLVMVAIGASMILPSAPAAVGVFEGATLIALKAYHVSRSAALPYALVLHLVNFLPFVLVGLILLRYNSRHPKRGTLAGLDNAQKQTAEQQI